MDLQAIKTKLNNNAELVFEKLGMKCEKFGNNIYSTCPVHDSSDNPRAFSFAVDKGIWKCWTRDCQHQFKNDIFGLIRGALSNNEGQDVGFSEAIKWGCNLLNLKKYNKSFVSEQTEDISNEFCQLISTLKEDIVSTLYTPITLESMDCPSKYFISRGFKEDTLKYFGVGDCHNTKSKMHNRAIIPIYDDEGKNVVAIIGRSVKEYKLPKFLFYPTGFSKAGLLYNYHNALEYIKKTNAVFIVEGQGDVWRLYESGIYNAVSIFGKSLSKEQESKLHKLPITHIIVLTDNDQAGRESKIQLQRQLGRMYRLSFPKMPTKDVGEMTIEQVQKIIIPQIKGNHI